MCVTTMPLTFRVCSIAVHVTMGMHMYDFSPYEDDNGLMIRNFQWTSKLKQPFCAILY